MILFFFLFLFFFDTYLSDPSEEKADTLKTMMSSDRPLQVFTLLQDNEETFGLTTLLLFLSCLLLLAFYSFYLYQTSKRDLLLLCLRGFRFRDANGSLFFFVGISQNILMLSAWALAELANVLLSMAEGLPSPITDFGVRGFLSVFLYLLFMILFSFFFFVFPFLPKRRIRLLREINR